MYGKPAKIDYSQCLISLNNSVNSV